MRTLTTKITLAGLVAVTLLLTLSGVNVAQAHEELKDKRLQASTCYVLARAKGEPEATLDVYKARLGKASSNMNIARNIGYYEGVLDTYGYVNSTKFGSFEASRKDAAITFYKLIGCTINVRI